MFQPHSFKSNSTTSLSLVFKLLKWIPLAALRQCAQTIAWILKHQTQHKLYQTIRRNLVLSFPTWSEQKIHDTTQSALTHQLLSYAEFIKIWGHSLPQNLHLISTVHGEALFHHAVKQTTGCLLIVPHFGSWELLNPWVGLHTQCTIMYKPAEQPDLDAFILAARSKENAILVSTDESGVRQIYRALKSGNTTAILPDHTPEHGGVYSPFFDIPLFSSTLAAKLALKSKSHVLLSYALRRDDGKFDVHFEPIDMQEMQTTDQAVSHIQYRIEQLIQRYPAHYHWMYKRYKAHPELTDIYLVSEQEARARAERLRKHKAEQ